MPRPRVLCGRHHSGPTSCFPLCEAPLQPWPLSGLAHWAKPACSPCLAHLFTHPCHCCEPLTKESFIASLPKKKKKECQRRQLVGSPCAFLFMSLHADGSYSICQCWSPVLFFLPPCAFDVFPFFPFSFSVAQKIKQGAPEYLLFGLLCIEMLASSSPTLGGLLCCRLPVTSILPSLLGLP